MYRFQYGNAILVPIRMGTNIVAGNLAPSLRDISNYELFKQELKTFLFRQAFLI